MRQHDFMPGALISTVACVGLILVAANSDVHEPSLLKATGKLLWVNASTRPPLLLVLAIGGWAWVVQVCRSRGMKIEQVLGGATQPVSATYHAALSLLCVVLCARCAAVATTATAPQRLATAAHRASPRCACSLAYFIASEHQGLRWRPWLTVNLGLLAVMVGLGCLPCRAFHADSRFSLLKALWESLIAPLAPVTFWHVIVADYLTSLAKTFSDLQLTGCISAAIV